MILRTLFRIARAAVRAGAEIGFSRSAFSNVDAMRVLPAVGGNRPEHGARIFACQPWLLLRPGRRRIKVAQGFQADYRRARDRHGIHGNAESMREIGEWQRIIAAIGGDIEQARHVRCPVALAIAILDQVDPAEQLGGADLRRIEIDVFDFHEHVQRRVGPIDARAIRAALADVPTPVTSPAMMTVRTSDVRAAVAPRDAECVQHQGLAAGDGLTDGAGDDIHAASR